uniref:ZT_dimer domain-containing protein n=1 Tax=Rhabditophanes sp. KR3021 TaxID=114890 RepID=A0AC35TUR2_9BILA
MDSKVMDKEKTIGKEEIKLVKKPRKSIVAFNERNNQLKEAFANDLAISNRIKQKYFSEKRKFSNVEHCAFHGSEANESLKPSTEISKSVEKNVALVSLLINIGLIVSKSIAVYLVGSLSILSTVLDSVVDCCASFIIFVISGKINNTKSYDYPRGRNRLEPLALIIIATIMGISLIQIIIQALKSIIEDNVTTHLDLASIIIMVSTIVIKTMLYYGLRRYSSSQSIQILSMDSRNDIISNSFSLLCVFINTYYFVYADVGGAIIVSLYILTTWFSTGLEHSQVLLGRSADRDLISRVINVSMHYHQDIKSIENVLVYYIGLKHLIEIYVKLDENMTLKQSDNILKGLQESLEELDFVERAFVHGEAEEATTIQEQNTSSQN